MDLVLLAARIILSLVFLAAVVAKTTDRAGLGQMLHEFGIPDRLTGPAAAVLLVAELGVAIALVPVATAWWGAVAALALLLVFASAVSVNLIRGHQLSCHCFGQIGAGPVDWKTLIRNIILGAIAALIVWQGRVPAGSAVLSVFGAPNLLTTVGLGMGVAALVLLVAEAWLLVQFWQLIGRLLLRIDALEARLVGGGASSLLAALAKPPEIVPAGLPVGSPAPSFRLDGMFGETLTLDALRAPGKAVLLAFLDPTCGPCSALLPEIVAWQRDGSARITLAVISRGSQAENRAKFADHRITHTLLQKKDEVARAYHAAGTPSAVLVRPDGTIGSAVAIGADAIRALAGAALSSTLPMPVLPSGAAPNGVNGQGCNGCGQGTVPPGAPSASASVGQSAPAFKLPGLDGKTVELASFRGSPTLVLFWNPSCGFCQRMLPDLKAWEANAPKGAPKLLVVSTGTAEANRAMGLRSPTVLDQGVSVGMSFGASGTPSAVLVDAKGNVASPVAVGAPDVLALATAAPTNGVAATA